jgi:hypothetical protein
MSGQRGKNQKGVIIMFDLYFLQEIDRALKKAGYSDRSKFVRDAIYEKLLSLGVHVNYELSMAPQRSGKGRNVFQMSGGKITGSVTQNHGLLAASTPHDPAIKGFPKKRAGYRKSKGKKK